MPTEQMIQSVMGVFASWSKDKREQLLVALIANKAAREIDDIDLVMDPEFARHLQPILDDPNLHEASIQALMRLNKAEEKKPGLFGRLLGRK